ncbi:MAG: peptidoglycan -binding protein [Pseudomonadota bacterium]
MALSRRSGNRFQGAIWPGFVDAMTGLLLVLMFVLTIFMIVQFVLRETISGQASELDALSAEVAALADALGLEQDKNATLTERVGELTVTLGDARAREEEQASLIATLQAERAEQDQALAEAATRLATFEEQVAGLLAQQEANLGTISDLEQERETLLSQQEQLNLALANLREEIDEQTEVARLAAARREALESLIADLRRRYAEEQEQTALLTGRVTELETQLSEDEAARLAEAAAAEALRDRLENADAELTAMTLALEEQRRQAEKTLTLLAAAQATQEDLNAQLAAALLAQDELSDANQSLEERLAAALEADAREVEDVRAALAEALAAKLAAEENAAAQLTEAEQQAVLLAEARARLSEEQEISTEAQRQQALLSQQVSALRNQLGQLQTLLDDAKAREAASDVQIQALGQDLNVALARAAAEERRRRVLEEEERKRLEEEAEDLQRYRSEFFGRLRDVLGVQEGVRIVGDRFVFSSEVLFEPARAELAEDGQAELAKVVEILRSVADEIPEGIDWVLQVDGHTDNVPIRNSPNFANNWELSQARALSVVLYMVNELGMPPERLSANGFGEFQPVAPGDSDEARAQNRRIELKFTEK